MFRRFIGYFFGSPADRGWNRVIDSVHDVLASDMNDLAKVTVLCDMRDYLQASAESIDLQRTSSKVWGERCRDQ